MIDKPTMVQTEAVKTAAIRIKVKREEIREAMGAGFQELTDVLTAQGVASAGPWFTHHFRMDPEVFDYEIAMPVKADVNATGRVRAGELPAMRAVQTVYHGGYEGLPEAWGEFDAWIEKKGLKTGADLVEIYRVGPESGDDSRSWQTELMRPLAE